MIKYINECMQANSGLTILAIIMVTLIIVGLILFIMAEYDYSKTKE